MTVHNDVGDIGKDSRSPIAPRLELKQFGSAVDKARRVLFRQKDWVLEERFDERNVRGNAANPEFPQCSVHPRYGVVFSRRPCGDFDKERVIVPGDHPSGIRCSSVESDADARRRPVGGKFAVVGDEIVLRIFGGNATLQGMASELYVLLPRRSGCSRDIRALRDPDLSLHDVDASYFFSDRVLDLDARVDFDEMEFARVDVH